MDDSFPMQPQMDEARRRIIAASAAGGDELDLGGLGLDDAALQALLPEMRPMSGLKRLWLGYAEAVRKKPHYERTDADKKICNALRALPAHLLAAHTQLEQLDLDGNQLAALPEAIGGLTALEMLSLGDNRLTVLPEAIGGLTALRSLSLYGNQLTALPEAIGNLTQLAAQAWRQKNIDIYGLRYASNPIASAAPFDRFIGYGHPATTVESINYLRRQQGLPAIIPDGYVSPDADGADGTPPAESLQELPDPKAIPEQAPNALVFGGAEDGPIQLAVRPDDAPLDSSAQRELYDEIKDKAQQLIEACGNSNRLGRTRETASRLLQAMGRELPELKERIFWSRMNSLRRAGEADQRAREARDPETPPMPEEVAGCLDDLIDTLNVFASGDPRLVEFDSQSIDPALRIATEELTKAAREIAEAARHAPEAIAPEAAEIMRDIAADAEGQSPSADRAKEFSSRSSRNLALELLRRAYRIVRDRLQRGVGWAAKATAATLVGGISGAAFVNFVSTNELVIRAIISELPASPTLHKIIDLIMMLA